MATYLVTIDGHEISVDIDTDGRILVEDEKRPVEVLPIDQHSASVKLGDSLHQVHLAKEGSQYVGLLAGGQVDVRVESERDRLLQKYAADSSSTSHRYEIHAPMPALVSRVEVSPGDSVQAGQGLIILEAMKMENEIKSPQAGHVKEVYVAAGKTVEKGELLILLE